MITSSLNRTVYKRVSSIDKAMPMTSLEKQKGQLAESDGGAPQWVQFSIHTLTDKLRTIDI